MAEIDGLIIILQNFHSQKYIPKTVTWKTTRNLFSRNLKTQIKIKVLASVVSDLS